ncbi:unnamed protein product [Paramecium sonneborni]|uniref:Uncharacterized protein n=1 Tax=Paramecium sonneborni TaxID=65129 RepID=A0A8S1L2G8_9CILI|nr:unnamed protein product [Paramecium sonneborni]
MQVVYLIVILNQEIYLYQEYMQLLNQFRLVNILLKVLITQLEFKITKVSLELLFLLKIKIYLRFLKKEYNLISYFKQEESYFNAQNKRNKIKRQPTNILKILLLHQIKLNNNLNNKKFKNHSLLMMSLWKVILSQTIHNHFNNNNNNNLIQSLSKMIVLKMNYDKSFIFELIELIYDLYFYYYVINYQFSFLKMSQNEINSRTFN